MLVIPVVRKLRQEDCYKSQVSMGYTARLSQEKVKRELGMGRCPKETRVPTTVNFRSSPEVNGTH